MLIGQVNLRDKRLNKRLGLILDRLGENYGSIPQSMQSFHETKAFYRFINNRGVSAEKIVASYEAGINKSAEFLENQVILGIQDTTELLYTGNRSAAELGCLHQSYQKGLFMDTLLLSKVSGTPFAISRLSFYAREAASLGKRRGKKGTSLPEHKESYRWIEGFKRFASYFDSYPSKQGVYIADREADMFAMFEAGKDYQNVHWVIRSKHNRNLVQGGKLHDYLDRQPERGKRTICYWNKEGQRQEACLSISYQTVQFKESRTDKISPVLYAVQAKQINPSKDKAICWYILTNKPIFSIDDAQQVLDYYVHRWLIERFFYVLKEGFLKVEDLQIKRIEALKNVIVLKSYQAMKIINLHKMVQEDPSQDLSLAQFEQEDYDLAYTYLQTHCYKNLERKARPTVFDFALLLTLLVGEKPSAKKLGLIRLSRGYEKFDIIKNTYLAMKVNRQTKEDVGNR